ncbi:Bug family tripartite tricarboxylate transporter substrate binding protein [Chloroflexota bacterium]
MKKWLSMSVIGLIGMVVIGTACAPPQGDEGKALTAEEFYRGATVEFIVGYPPGGGFDTYGRVVAPFLGKELGVKQIMINNMPGGGGFGGANWVYLKAPRDGKTISIITGGKTVLNELLGESIPVEFKSMREFSIISVFSQSRELVVVTPELPYNSLQDLKGASGLIGAASTPFSTHGINSVIMAECLNLQDFSVNYGYAGTADMVTAVFRGEADIMFLEAPTALPNIKANYVKPLGTIGSDRSPYFPDLPSFAEVAVPGTERLLEIRDGVRKTLRFWCAPPEIPEDRLEFLRQAFARMLQNPDFQAAAEKRGLEIIDATIGEEAEAVVEKLLGLPEKDKQELRSMVLKYAK